MGTGEAANPACSGGDNRISGNSGRPAACSGNSATFLAQLVVERDPAVHRAALRAVFAVDLGADSGIEPRFAVVPDFAALTTTVPRLQANMRTSSPCNFSPPKTRRSARESWLS